MLNEIALRAKWFKYLFINNIRPKPGNTHSAKALN